MPPHTLFFQVDPSTGHTFYVHSITGEHVWLPLWLDMVDPDSGYSYYTNTKVGCCFSPSFTMSHMTEYTSCALLAFEMPNENSLQLHFTC